MKILKLENCKQKSTKDKLRSYSNIFSRRVFSEIIDYNDFTYIDIIAKRYDLKKISKPEITYFDYLKYIYKKLSKFYACEYVYKNTIINELLVKKYGTKDTIVINEFRVKKSIVDLALFNGTSKSFEIKTEFDSDKRLKGQLSDYTALFQECYVVVAEKLVKNYKNSIDANVGIISFSFEKGKAKLNEIRQPVINQTINTDVLIRSVRTEEYKNIVKAKFGSLPTSSNFEMFEMCKEKMFEIPETELQQLFLTEIKKRKTVTSNLSNYDVTIRQICLSMNISQNDYNQLDEKLYSPIII